MADRLIAMASVGSPHGVRGAVRLNVFAEEPLALRRYNPFEDEAGRRYKLTGVRRVGRAIVAEIDGVDDRDRAAELSGRTLFVPRGRLPRPAEEEYYHVDLVGLEARTVDGRSLGRVAGVADHGAGDVLEVRGRQSVLVPFTRAVVPEVCVAAGYLLIDPPQGLFEEDADEGEDEASAGAGVRAAGTGATDNVEAVDGNDAVPERRAVTLDDRNGAGRQRTGGGKVPPAKGSGE